MLPDAERLRKSGLFQRVYTARKSVSTGLVSLYVLSKQTKISARMPLAGFVASKKTLNKATDRNRAKRRVREAYRTIKTEMKLGSSGDESSQQENIRLEQWYAIVWVIQADVLKAEFKDIMKSVQHCLQKANQKFGIKRASS